jgi:hypothetical protein
MTMATVEPEALPVPVGPTQLGGLPYLADFARLADAIARTEMVPDSLRGRADAVLAVLMAGYELGVGPMMALQSINMIKGKPSLSPELMRALVTKAGHSVIVEATNEEASLRAHRREWPDDAWVTFTWTMEDAKRAGLLKGTDSSWAKYPRAMLTARVTSEACRATFPDVIAGLSYGPDELTEFAPVTAGLSGPGEVAVVDVEASETPAPVDPRADEAMQGLSAIIADVQPDDVREALVAHLRETFGPSRSMSPAQIEAATAIAAGWPDTAPPSA